MKNVIILLFLCLCFLITSACTNTNYYKTYLWEQPVRIPDFDDNQSKRLPTEVENLINTSPFFKGSPINKKLKLKYTMRNYDNGKLSTETYVNQLWQSNGKLYLQKTRIEAENSYASNSANQTHNEVEYIANGLVPVREHVERPDAWYTTNHDIALLKVSGTVFPARKGRRFAFLFRKDNYGVHGSLYDRDLELTSCTWGDTKKASEVWSLVTWLLGDVVALNCDVLHTNSSSTWSGKLYKLHKTHYFSKYLRMFVDEILNLQYDKTVTDVHAEIIRQ